MEASGQSNKKKKKMELENKTTRMAVGRAARFIHSQNLWIQENFHIYYEHYLSDLNFNYVEIYYEDNWWLGVGEMRMHSY
jgi:hypothetical protein